MVVVRGLNMFPSMVAAVLNEFPELSGDYRITLDTPPPYDALPVSAELADGVPKPRSLRGRVERRDQVAAGRDRHRRDLPGNTFPRSEGKTKRVIRSYQ